MPYSSCESLHAHSQYLNRHGAAAFSENNADNDAKELFKCFPDGDKVLPVSQWRSLITPNYRGFQSKGSPDTFASNVGCVTQDRLCLGFRSRPHTYHEKESERDVKSFAISLAIPFLPICTRVQYARQQPNSISSALTTLIVVASDIRLYRHWRATESDLTVKTRQG